MKQGRARANRGQGGRKATQALAHPVRTLTRTAVASRLGKTVSGVRHLEGTELHPKKVDGAWLFDEREVEDFARRRMRRENELSPGELAAQACELFRQGKDAVDAVIALREPFEVILPLLRAFTEESGSVLLSRTFAERLAQICNVPNITPDGLVQALERRDRTIDELTARLHDARPNIPRE